MTAAVDERSRLLGLTAGYLLDHGVAGLTLRSLGQAIGTNNRMLLYYFGSKENLISEALVAATHQFPAMIGAFDALDDARRPLAERLQDVWRSISSPANLPQIRLFFEVFGLAAHDPGRYGDYLAGAGSYWVEVVAAALRTEGLAAVPATRTARHLVSVWRGLQFDLLSGADIDEIDAAHAEAAALVAAQIAAPRAAGDPPSSAAARRRRVKTR